MSESDHSSTAATSNTKESAVPGDFKHFICLQTPGFRAWYLAHFSSKISESALKRNAIQEEGAKNIADAKAKLSEARCALEEAERRAKIKLKVHDALHSGNVEMKSIIKEVLREKGEVKRDKGRGK